MTEEKKTAKEKAEYWLNNNIAGWDLKHLEYLTILLKEQDRDTRHACAEEVIKQGHHPAIEILDHCHNACMNARAV